MNILADRSLPDLMKYFPSPFKVTTYQTISEVQTQLPLHDILICRSTLQVNQTLLKDSALQCVATASSGVDHIDEEYLHTRHIKLFDAKGSNARSVADYVTATLAWVELKQMIQGKQAGIIGIGEAGSQVYERLKSAGYDIKIFDPYKPDTKSSQHVKCIEELRFCDLLCIHANLHHQRPFPSANLLNGTLLNTLKPGIVIINAARGGIVNEADLLQITHPIHYCTDVYLNEPDINPQLVNFAELCTPHIAGHSIEAKVEAVKMLSIQLHQYFALPTPISASPNDIWQLDINPAKPWQKQILDYYNPVQETNALKKSIDKKSAYIQLRQAHTNRHDFAYYL